MKCYYEYIPDLDNGEFPCVIIVTGEKQGDYEVIGTFPNDTVAKEWGDSRNLGDHWYIKAIRPIFEIDH
jgi:hypothetical protein